MADAEVEVRNPSGLHARPAATFVRASAGFTSEVTITNLTRDAEFMSIGTNDLTQYLLAADRSNAALAARQDPLHPAVLRAISRVVDAATATSCEVAVCGEMAGDPVGALVLVGLGVDELSMEPRAFGAVKRAIGARGKADLVGLATAAQHLSTAADVRDAMELIS